jgi:hypothetical protein
MPSASLHALASQALCTNHGSSVGTMDEYHHSSVAGANSALDAVSIKLAGAAQRAATTEPEALEPWAESVVQYRLDTALQHGLTTSGKITPKALPRAATTMSKCTHNIKPLHDSTDGEQAPAAVLQVDVPVDECKHKLALEALQNNLTKHAHERALPVQADPAVQRPDRLPRAHTTECNLLLQEMPLGGMLIIIKAVGTCRPERKPPWEANLKSRRPFKARVMHTDCTQK